ncbi:MAG: tetratricopeptide repeat protein, partial [Sphingobium sp.]
MKRKALSNIAASSLIIAGTMVGCSGAALNTRAGASAGKLEQMAASQARDVERALAAHDSGKAIQIAEAAVAASPNDAEYRTLLGRSYLMAGRFNSARTAFEDALTLGSNDTRTIVNLALIHVAQGRYGQAQQLLTDRIADLPAADYGLAMAMSGEPEEAIRVLQQAIQDPAATSKERQNLAYAYAIGGHWVEASQMAAFDLPPQEVSKRVTGWAQFSQSGGEGQRVIAMMGVSPRADDAGLPVRLALRSAAPEAAPVQMAASAAPKAPGLSISLPETADDANDLPAPIEVAEVDPTPMAEADPVAAFEPVPPSAAPLYRPESRPAILADAEPELPSGAPLSPLLRPTPNPLRKQDVPAPRQASIWRPVDPATGSAWVVQLGAFSTPEAAKAAW